MSGRLHSTNMGRTSGLVALGLEGSSIFWMAGSIAVSIGIFLVLYAGLNFGFFTAVAIAVFPSLLSLIVILTLVRGKPAYYLDEFAEWQILRIRIAVGIHQYRLFSRAGRSRHPVFQ